MQQTKNSLSRLIALSLCAVSSFLITACATGQLAYKIDPEINNINNFSKASSLIALSVIDKRPQINQLEQKEVKTIARGKDEAKKIRAKILDKLKQNNYKIISNPLLADLSLKIEIVEFKATVESQLFKSTLRVSSQLRLKANKQGNTLEKLYKMKRSQEVANPVSSIDITGLVNQLLSKQLSDILSDPALAKLSAD